MLTDAHCHPYDLSKISLESAQEQRLSGVLAAASACSEEEFLYNEELSRNTPLILCFGIHPQLPSLRQPDDKLPEMLELLASEKRIAAIGECGFDLYNSQFKETELLQEHLFSFHLEIALRYDLPVVLHVRRAMHKIFSLTKTLSKCKTVVFHSWPGTLEEANALLKQGVNAYFSFGNIIMLNHKRAMRCCAMLPLQRLLTETDAPYQMRKGQLFSHWQDLHLILESAAALRREAGNNINTKALEIQIEDNFKKAYLLNYS
ncbi:MAG: TatD family hydrolase [Treponema sp.]|nr:TatD family hydrolase [Treponema sp.]